MHAICRDKINKSKKKKKIREMEKREGRFDGM
jgi:hypothetical protein